MAKTDFEAKYSVILREGIPPLELEFFEKLTGGVRLKNGAKLRQFYCKNLRDVGYYLEMDIFKLGEDWVLPIKIPNHYVLLVSGEEPQGRAPGFVWDME